MNTDDLVRRVKDALSQYSISQRLFGETVLGLSQGSVSDLLARPKPWHLLTQKGREPFIRMQIFLEDEASVSRLVATQYQIPADKFLRTSSSSSSAPPPLFSDCSTPSRQFCISLTSKIVIHAHKRCIEFCFTKCAYKVIKFLNRPIFVSAYK